MNRTGRKRSITLNPSVNSAFTVFMRASENTLHDPVLLFASPFTESLAVGVSVPIPTEVPSSKTWEFPPVVAPVNFTR